MSLGGVLCRIHHNAEFDKVAAPRRTRSWAEEQDILLSSTRFRRVGVGVSIEGAFARAGSIYSFYMFVDSSHTATRQCLEALNLSARALSSSLPPVSHSAG